MGFYGSLMDTMDYGTFSLQDNPFEKIRAETMLAYEADGNLNLDEILKTMTPTEADFQIAQVLKRVLGGAGIIFSLEGPHGMGKSSRAYAIQTTFQQQKGLAFVWKVAESKDVGQLTFRLINSIGARILSSNIGEPTKQKIGDIVQTYLESLGAHEGEGELDSYQVGQDIGKIFKYIADEGVPSCFIIDDFEEAVSTPGFIDIIAELTRFSLGTKKHMLMFCSNISVSQELKGGVHTEVEIHPLSKENARELIEKRLTYYRTDTKRKGLDPFQPGVIDRANELAQGNPRYLLRIMYETLEIALKKQLDEIDESIISSGELVAREEEARRLREELRTTLSDQEMNLFFKLIEDFGGGPISPMPLSQKLDMSYPTCHRILTTLAQKDVVSKSKQGKSILFQVKNRYMPVFGT
ncbi:MAG: hypothetical protein ACFFCQ_08065 [Promethearchaeota archaeon]